MSRIVIHQVICTTLAISSAPEENQPQSSPGIGASLFLGLGGSVVGVDRLEVCKKWRSSVMKGGGASTRSMLNGGYSKMSMVSSPLTTRGCSIPRTDYGGDRAINGPF